MALMDTLHNSLWAFEIWVCNLNIHSAHGSANKYYICKVFWCILPRLTVALTIQVLGHHTMPWWSRAFIVTWNMPPNTKIFKGCLQKGIIYFQQPTSRNACDSFVIDRNIHWTLILLMLLVHQTCWWHYQHWPGQAKFIISTMRLSKWAFDIANSGLVIQEAQLLDMLSAPMLHLLCSDKSYSKARCGMYPICGEWKTLKFDIEKFTTTLKSHKSFIVVCKHGVLCHITCK